MKKNKLRELFKKLERQRKMYEARDKFAKEVAKMAKHMGRLGLNMHVASDSFKKFRNATKKIRQKKGNNVE